MPKINVKNANQRASSRREEIIRKAAALFREFGFNGTSIEDIALAVDLPKGGIYNHIKSKEELLYEIVTRGIRHFLPALREIKTSKYDIRETFRCAVYTNVFMLATYHDVVAVFLQDKRSLSQRHYLKYIGYRDEVEKIFKDIIRQGMKERVFRKADVNLTTFVVLGMCNWVTQWYREDGKLKPEEIAAFFADAADRMMQPNG